MRTIRPNIPLVFIFRGLPIISYILIIKLFIDNYLQSTLGVQSALGGESIMEANRAIYGMSIIDIMTKVLTLLVIVSILFAIITILPSFFKRITVNETGMRVKQGIFSREKQFAWNDVTSVTIRGFFARLFGTVEITTINEKSSIPFILKPKKIQKEILEIRERALRKKNGK